MPLPLHRFVDGQRLRLSESIVTVVRERPDASGNIVVRTDGEEPELIEALEDDLDPVDMVIKDHWCSVSSDGEPSSRVFSTVEGATRDALRFRNPAVLGVVNGGIDLRPLEGEVAPTLMEFWRALDHEGAVREQTWLSVTMAVDEAIRFHYTHVMHVSDGVVSVIPSWDREDPDGRYALNELQDREQLFAEFGAWDGQVSILEEAEAEVAAAMEETAIGAMVEAVAAADEIDAAEEAIMKNMAVDEASRADTAAYRYAIHPVNAQEMIDELTRLGHADRIPQKVKRPAPIELKDEHGRPLH